MGCHVLLQGIFPAQGSNPGLPHSRQILYSLSRQESLGFPDRHSVQFSSVAQSCPTLCDPRDCSPPGSSVHGDSPAKNTGVGCHALLQGIFPTQGSNPGLPHCRWILYCLSHQDTTTTATTTASNTECTWYLQRLDYSHHILCLHVPSLHSELSASPLVGWETPAAWFLLPQPPLFLPSLRFGCHPSACPAVPKE